MFGEIFKHVTKITLVFLIMVCVLMLGAFYLRDEISDELNALEIKLASTPEHSAIATMLLDLNKADNNYQEAVINGDTAKYNSYRASLIGIFNRLDTIMGDYTVDTSLQFTEHDRLLKQALTGKIELSSKVFQMKKDLDSLLLNTERNFNDRSASLTLKKVIPGRLPKTVTLVDTIFEKTEKVSGKRKGFFGRLKDAVLNKSDKDSVGSTIVIAQKEKKIVPPEIAGISAYDGKLSFNLLNKLKIGHINLSSYQLELALSNQKLITELRDVLTKMNIFYNELWAFKQKEYLKKHASATQLLDRFNLFIMSLIIVFLILLFFYIDKVRKAEIWYKKENERAVSLAEERSEMLAKMSHEIRNPLMAITGFIDLIQDDELTPAHRKMVESIHTASDMLIGTVNDILDITKFQHDTSAMIRVKPFMPFQELRNVIDTLRFVVIKKGISIQYTFEGPQDAEVQGDAFRLKQVLLNLLNNAIRFTDIGGVEVHAKLTQDGKASWLHVVVTDTGVGIKKELQSGLFSKYFQAHHTHERGGSGLGLYICKQLLELQGGSITVFSDGEGKGSTFTFTIPYAD